MTALDLRLRQALHPWRVAPAWRIAFSGGLDSSVLLHLLADWARHEQLPPLSAVHVHHGLQSAADAWPEHCASVCEQLGIALEIVRVQVALGASLEQAARRARYKAFSERLKPGRCCSALSIVTIRPRPCCFVCCVGRVCVDWQPCRRAARWGGQPGSAAAGLLQGRVAGLCAAPGPLLDRGSEQCQ